MQRLFNSFPRRLYFVLLFVIFSYAVYTRFRDVVTGYFAFTDTVGRDMLVLYDMVFNGKFTLIGPMTGVPGVFHGPWWYYFLAMPYRIADGSPYGVATFMSLAGVAVVVLFTFLATLLWGRKWGVLVALFTALSPQFVDLSHITWNAYLLPIFMLITISFFVYALSMPRLYAFVLLGIAAGLTFETEVAFGIAFLPAFTLAVVFSFYRIAKKRTYLLMSAYAVGVLFAFIPRGVFELRHSFVQTGNLIRAFSGGQGLAIGESVIVRFSDRVALFFSPWVTMFGDGSIFIGLVVFLVAFLSLLAIYRNDMHRPRPLLTLSLSTIAFLFFAYLFYPGTVWPYYLIGLPILYSLFVFIVLREVTIVLPRLRVLVFVFVIVLAFVSGKPWNLVSGDSQPASAENPDFFRNKAEVVDYLYKEANGLPFTVRTYTPSSSTAAWDYLFVWHGARQWGYEPSTEPQAIFYTIVEPDTFNPGARAQWLEERLIDGKIVKEATPAGTITVQTRILQ